MFGYKKGFSEGWQYGFNDGIKLVKIDDKITSLKGPEGIKSQDYWDGYADCHKDLEQSGVSFVSEDYLDAIKSRAFSAGYKYGKAAKKYTCSKSFKEGYDQGRFDVFAGRTAKQTQAVKERMERQAHCPYCHEPFKEKKLGNATVMDSHGSTMFSVTRVLTSARVPALMFKFKELFSGCETRHLVECSFCPECGRKLGDDNDED